MSFLGADTDELRGAADECMQGKEVTDQVIQYLQALIALLKAASFFSGGASAAYAEYLETVVVPWLQKISQALELFAKVLGANAEAQDQASQGETVDAGSLPSYTSQVSGSSAVQPFNGSVLGSGSNAGAAFGAITGAATGTGWANRRRPRPRSPSPLPTAPSRPSVRARAPTAGTGAAGAPIDDGARDHDPDLDHDHRRGHLPRRRPHRPRQRRAAQRRRQRVAHGRRRRRPAAVAAGWLDGPDRLRRRRPRHGLGRRRHRCRAGTDAGTSPTPARPRCTAAWAPAAARLARRR